MPNCFQLSRKGVEPFTPVPLAVIDRELCVALGVAEDPQMYVACWVDTIGFELAMGRTLDQVIAKYKAELAEDPGWRSKAQQVRAAEWLNENYVTDAFYQHK